MPKRVSLSIPEDNYAKLATLCDFYKLDVKQTISDILYVMGLKSQSIIYTNKEYKVPVKLTTIILDLFDAGFKTTHSLFNVVLEKLGVKGLFTLDDFDIKLDENHMWLLYIALEGCGLCVDEFDVTIGPGTMRLTATSFIDTENVSSEALEKLKGIVHNIEEEGKPNPPKEFYELEEYSIEIEEEEDSWALKFDCYASFDSSPKISTISKYFERIFKRAGITR